MNDEFFIEEDMIRLIGIIGYYVFDNSKVNVVDKFYENVILMKCFIKEPNNFDFSDYLIRFDVIPIKLKLNDLIERGMLFFYSI